MTGKWFRFESKKFFKYTKTSEHKHVFISCLISVATSVILWSDRTMFGVIHVKAHMKTIMPTETKDKKPKREREKGNWLLGVPKYGSLVFASHKCSQSASPTDSAPRVEFTK